MESYARNEADLTPFMGKVGARDLCNNYFIAFADLRFQITNLPMG
jgi:hypothetical protein